MLCVESVQSMAAAESRAPDRFRLLMTKQQAALLGNYLTQHSGATPAGANERSWFRRLFG